MKNWELAEATILPFERVQGVINLARERGWGTDADFFTVAAGAALRVSEVAHTTAEDLQGDRLMLVSRKKRELEAAPVCLAPYVLSILRRRAALVGSGYLFPGKAEPCVIERDRDGVETTEKFCDGGHRPLRTIKHHWRVLLETVGLYTYGRGIHTLRHVGITEFYRVTKDPLQTQAFARHESFETTRRYIHFCLLKEALASMPVLL